MNIQRAAEQRTELSPRRGFASLGYWFVGFGEPRSGDRKFITGVPPIPMMAVAPSGLAHLRGRLTQGSRILALGLTLSAAPQLVPLRRDYRLFSETDAVSGLYTIALASWSQKNPTQVSQVCYCRLERFPICGK